MAEQSSAAVKESSELVGNSCYATGLELSLWEASGGAGLGLDRTQHDW